MKYDIFKITLITYALTDSRGGKKNYIYQIRLTPKKKQK
jgi:hypothetical protein